MFNQIARFLFCKTSIDIIFRTITSIPICKLFILWLSQVRICVVRCFCKMKLPNENLKKRILQEIQEENIAKVDLEKYKLFSEKLEESRRNCLDIVTKGNRQLRKKKEKPLPEASKFKPQVQDAYEKWKNKNYVEKKCPEVCVKQLLHLIYYLNAKPAKNKKNQYEECLRRQNSTFEAFWDTPSYILKVLRKCVLTRDWSNMTYFCLILLNYDRKYVPIVRNMCKTMVRCNPMVKEYNLEDQFKSVIEPAQHNLTRV